MLIINLKDSVYVFGFPAIFHESIYFNLIKHPLKFISPFFKPYPIQRVQKKVQNDNIQFHIQMVTVTFVNKKP